MQLTIEIISYSRPNARAERIFRGALKNQETTYRCGSGMDTGGRMSLLTHCKVLGLCRLVSHDWTGHLTRH